MKLPTKIQQCLPELFERNHAKTALSWQLMIFFLLVGNIELPSLSVVDIYCERPRTNSLYGEQIQQTKKEKKRES